MATNVAAETPTRPLRLRTRPAINMTDADFFDFCQLNRDLRFERTAEGEIVVMSPTGWETSVRNSKLTAQLAAWAARDGSGFVSDSSAGFVLPNGAIRSPDVAWVRRSRLAGLTAEQKQKFLPLCPDFVIELRSASDDMAVLQEKMQEYVGNGAQLGWLIDPAERTVHVYAAGAAATRVENATQISGDPVLPGFVLDLTEIWAADR